VIIEEEKKSNNYNTIDQNAKSGGLTMLALLS